MGARGMALSMVLAALAACSGDDGGSSTTGDSSGAAGSGGAGGVSTGASGGAGGAAQGGGGSGGGSTACDALAAEVAAKLTAAKACTGASNQECQAFVDGMCCPEVVTESNAPATQEYLDALAAFEQAGCVADCPAVPCQPTNQGLCSGGSCIPFQN
jgi:hypothetical protein